MRILVTGAQGCIGAWTVKALLDRGLDVLSYDLDPELRRLSLIAPSEQMARVAVRTGRIEDTARVKALVKDEQITHIVHLAAQLMPFCQAHPVEGAMVNIIGTLNVFEDTARVKALVKDEQITHIVHLAAQLMPFCQAHPVEGAMVNIIGTLNVF